MNILTRCFPALASLFLASLPASAQQNNIETDRPDQTDGVAIVDKNHLQLETEIYLNTFKYHKPAVISSSLLRYGLSKHIEARFVAEQGKNRDVFIDETVQGIYPLAAGFKVLIAEEKSNTPGIAVISQVQLPFTNPSGARNLWSPSFILSLEKKVGDLSFCTNSGIKQNPFDADWCWPVSLDVKYEANKSFQLFTEYFAQYDPLRIPDHNADAGILYHVNRHTAVYGAVGARLFNPEHNYFVNTGMAIML